MPEVDEIADGVYRIATFVEDDDLSLNQFLILDDEPLLFHTGPRAMFRETLDGIARVLDPERLRWVSWSHFEADETGALNEFLEFAPHALPVHTEFGAALNADDFAVKPTRTVPDGGAVDLGRHRLRLLATPHVPHCWDAVMAFETTTATLFTSDLLAQLGHRPPVTDSDVVEPALSLMRAFPDVIPIGGHTFAALDRLVALEPATLAIHHGGACNGDATRALVDFGTGLRDMAGTPR